MSSPYRSHTCGQLRPEHVGQTARLSGWVQRKRDHGNLLFIDLRDHYGVTQVVIDSSSPVFKTAEAVRRRGSTPTLLESSGGLALATARAYAETGVEFLAVGALTHSVTARDVGLDLRGA